MADFIDQFEKECAAADVKPVEALRAAGMHRSTWFRWKSGTNPPNLRNLEKAQEGIKKAAAQAHQQAA